MKRNIIYTFLVAAALLFTACGSDSKVDPIAPIETPTDPITPTDPTDPTNPIDPTLPIIDTAGMTLTAAPSEINIATAGESKEITIQLANGINAVTDTNIKADIFDLKSGKLESLVATTNANGEATFTYIAPDVLPTADLNITFRLENGVPDLSMLVMVKFGFSVIPPSGVLPLVVVPIDNIKNSLTVNNEIITLALKVFDGVTNTPYSTGKVKVELPAKVITGVDVGSFTAYEVPIVNGIATFNYVGPNNLQGLIDNGDLNSTFLFYHEDNALDKKQVTMIYEPDADSGYIPVNYELIVTSQDGNMTTGLEKEKTFSVVLKDDKSNTVADDAITSIVITSKNDIVGKLLDNGNEVSTLTVTGQNPVNFNIRTYTNSGLLPIEIVVNFVDPNGIVKQLKQTVNIIVYSGPATAMSISYVGVEQDEDSAKYIEKFAVTVVDAYNNKVNTQPFVSVGAMVEYAVDGSSIDGIRTTSSPRLWYGKFDSPYGSIIPGASGATFETSGGGDIFKWVDFDNDKLVIFGEGYVYEALGKWDIKPGIDENSLDLSDDYFGIPRDGLFYAVGHNKRQDLCSQDGTEYVGSAKSDTYQINEQGSAFVEFEYDYHLTGKDIMLWVNLSGYQADTNTVTRIGEARKHTLRGNGFTKAPEAGYTLKEGTSGYGTFVIRHENAPEWYRNGHFAYAVKSGSTCSYNVVAHSNPFDARTCDNRMGVDTDNDPSTPDVLYGTEDGTSYVTFFLEASTGDCTFDIEDITVTNEF